MCGRGSRRRRHGCGCQRADIAMWYARGRDGHRCWCYCTGDSGGQHERLRTPARVMRQQPARRAAVANTCAGTQAVTTAAISQRRTRVDVASSEHAGGVRRRRSAGMRVSTQAVVSRQRTSTGSGWLQHARVRGSWRRYQRAGGGSCNVISCNSSAGVRTLATITSASTLAAVPRTNVGTQVLAARVCVRQQQRV